MSKPALIIGFDGLSPLFWEHEPKALELFTSHGVLKSVDPYISPAAWTSFLTGADPSEHGITRWRRPGWDPQLPVFGHSHSMPLWLGEFNKTTFALYNVPCLKPVPVALNVTYFVGGLLWGADEQFTKPTGWRGKLLQDGYVVYVNGVEDVQNKHGDEYYDACIRGIPSRRMLPLDVADVTVLVYVFPDVVSHAFWGVEGAIIPMHSLVTLELRRLKAEGLFDTHDVLVVSDHGFGPIDTPEHDALLAGMGERRVPWMRGGHHPNGVFMSNRWDLTGKSIKDALVTVLQERGGE